MQDKFPRIGCRRLSEIEFCRWLGEASPGARLEYHLGFLALDLTPDATALLDSERKRLRAVANRARWAFERDLVHLVQLRLGAERFSYIAIARSKRQRKRQEGLTTALVWEAA